MSYHGIGAGPGPVKTYKVDLPFPWGDDTEVTLPLDAIVKDAAKAIPVASLVQAAWTQGRPLLEAEVPSLITTYVDPKFAQAEYIVSQALKDVEATAGKAVKHVYIAAGLIVAGVGLVLWWGKK
jgi:hypothetical protein